MVLRVQALQGLADKSSEPGAPVGGLSPLRGLLIGALVVEWVKHLRCCFYWDQPDCPWGENDNPALRLGPDTQVWLMILLDGWLCFLAQ